jgi:uncharacterized protein
VDLVSIDARTQKPVFAVEIKWSDDAYGNWPSLRGLRELAARHPLRRRPLVTTKTAAGVLADRGFEVEFTPTSLHCFTIANNLLLAAR